jgi:rubredoxin
MKCALCGFEFEENNNTCRGCLFSKNCRMLCCPNCGYKIPSKSKILTFFEKRREKNGSK